MLSPSPDIADQGAPPHGQVGETAYLLGFAGLLPQTAALASTLFGGMGRELGPIFALGYASLLISFVGGCWWGLAMRSATRQGLATSMSVVPALIAAAVLLLVTGGVVAMAWSLVVIGSAAMLLLLVDRRLADNGQTPQGWLQLRIPLSLGLGVLTILTGVAATA